MSRIDVVMSSYAQSVQPQDRAGRNPELVYDGNAATLFVGLRRNPARNLQAMTNAVHPALGAVHPGLRRFRHIPDIFAPREESHFACA
jgi:hypothetical protein